MTTEKQIAANRLNALRSTGPRTKEGKNRCRKNALRHGLTSETVVAAFECADKYAELENAIISDYEPKTATEYQLVARLASLLWRLRRTVAVETGLLQTQANILDEYKVRNLEQAESDSSEVFEALRRTTELESPGIVPDDALAKCESSGGTRKPSRIDASRCLLRLSNVNGPVLDRINRYETALWRQVAQAIVLLGPLRKFQSEGRASDGTGMIEHRNRGDNSAAWDPDGMSHSTMDIQPAHKYPQRLD